MADATNSYTTIEESDNAIRIHVELPDVGPEDVTLDVEPDSLQVIVPKAPGVDVPEDGIYSSVPLPANADVDKLQASIAEGHLDIIIPKTA
jgi:HSP20 family molecular chaperone IbpA